MVTNNGWSTNGVSFYVNPNILSLQPSSGSAGTVLTITGSTFGTTPGIVSFPYVGAAVNSWSDTQIVVTVPPGATTGNVTVQPQTGLSAGAPFSVTTPAVGLLSPYSGAPGAVVTIFGSGFGATQGSSSTVTFNGTLATTSSWSDTQIVATVPDAATTGQVVVTVNGQSSPVGFASLGGTTFFSVLVTITSLSPSTGSIGTILTITGTGFGTNTGFVTFSRPNGTVAIISSWSPKKIVATVPEGATTGNVFVAVPSSGLSNGVLFTVSTPAIGNLSPHSGSAGTLVTITGSGFGATQGSSSTVTFNGVPATPQTWSDTQIVVPVPVAATSGQIVVTVNGQSSPVDQPIPGYTTFFTVPIVITSLSPNVGPVGTVVTITGSGFGTNPGLNNALVAFPGVGGAPSSWSPTQIVVPVPNWAATGDVFVFFLNQGNSNGVLFTVQTPALASLVVYPQNFSLPAGEQRPFIADGTYIDGTKQVLTSTVTWASSAPNIATVDSSGVVTAVSQGTTTISATLGSISSSTPLTVIPPVLASIAVTPANPSAITATTQQFTATGIYSDNSKQDLTSGATWTSSTTTVATINSAGLAAAIAQGTTTITASFGGFNASTTLTIIPGGFVPVGGLFQPRWQHTATLLPNGKVLIVGGLSQTSSLASAELYDPVTRSFTPTGSLSTARENHTATLLPNGKVLIAGGGYYDPYYGTDNPLATAELYDPSTGTFSPTGNLTTIREYHTATLLQNGKVLLVGGGPISGELYDPATGKFTATGNNVVPRSYHTASLLNDGTVLIAGGYSSNRLASAEIYNPATGSFTATGSLAYPVVAHTSTLLNSGKVLIAGGENTAATARTQIYDPVATTFFAGGNLATARFIHTATLLNNSNVLVAGGNVSSGNATGSAELFDPSNQTFTGASSLATSTRKSYKPPGSTMEPC